MRLSWRTKQVRAADQEEATLAFSRPEPRSDHVAAVVHLLFLFLIAVVLRIRGLDRYSLWHDEVVTMRLATTANPAAMIRLLDQIDGTRAPLHPLILQIWLRFFGTSEVALHRLAPCVGLSPC